MFIFISHRSHKQSALFKYQKISETKLEYKLSKQLYNYNAYNNYNHSIVRYIQATLFSLQYKPDSRIPKTYI